MTLTAITKNFRRSLLALVTVTLLTAIPNRAHAASMSGHMHMQAYNLTWFGMRPSVALMMAMYNQATDDNIATSAFTLAVGEGHFTLRTAAELRTMNTKQLGGFISQLKTLRSRIMSKGTTMAMETRSFRHLDDSLAVRDFKQVATAIHTIVDLTSFHVGYAQPGHAHDWTRPDELNPPRVQRMVKIDASLTVLYAILDIDHVMFTPEARERILGGFNLSQKVFDQTIDRLNLLLKRVGDTNSLTPVQIGEIRAEIVSLGKSLIDNTKDPALKLERAYWEDVNNQKLIENLPVRGSREYFDKFIYPELAKRVHLDNATVQAIDPQFREKLISARYDYYVHHITEEMRSDNALRNFDSSATDNRDFIPAYLTRDLVEVSVRAELLRDVLKQLGVFEPGTNGSDGKLSEMGKLIVQNIGGQLRADGLPFAGMVDIINFEMVNKAVFGNPYGQGVSALDFILNRARSHSVTLVRNAPGADKPFRVDPTPFSEQTWIQARYDFLKTVTPSQGDTPEQVEAKKLEAAKIVAEFYVKHLINSKAVLESNQQITLNLCARLAPVPESWGPKVQTFENPASDAWTVRREKQLILENYYALAGIKFKYAWNPAQEWRLKVVDTWKKEQARIKNVDVEEISDPNLIRKIWLWWSSMDKIPLVNAREYVIIAPNGLMERMSLWLSGMKRMILAGYGFRATPAGKVPELGLSGSIGNRFRQYAQSMSDIWRRSAGMDIGLLTPQEYEKRLEALRQVNAKYAPASKLPTNAFARMAELPNDEAPTKENMKFRPQSCRAVIAGN